MSTTLRKKLQNAAQRYRRFTAKFAPALQLPAQVLSVAAFVGSIACLVALTVWFGYDHTPDDVKWIRRTLRGCQILFATNILYSLATDFRRTIKQSKAFKWIVDIAVLLTLLPLAYPHPAHPWIPVLERVLYSGSFLYSILAAYAVVDISYGLMKMLGKRTNPSLILTGSFIVLILAGSFILMMPRCTTSELSYVDSLFVATSAVCITGLTPVDISTTFSLPGLAVLGFLIQAGGLGVMTFTSFFALFFSGNTSVYNQLMMKDIISSKTIGALVPTLFYILGFTLLIEALGAGAFFLCIHGELNMSLQDEIIFSLFHSLSAFCNAGFSNIEGGLSNPALLHSNQSVYIVASVLIAAGGIGFPILMNVAQATKMHLRALWHRIRRDGPRRLPIHIYDLNTKIVVATTGWIFAVSATLFLLFEYDNTLSGMTAYEKVVQSVFNAWVPRSSGFSSVNPASMLNITLLMFVVLMWIGGGSQSTAGGIKVNTFAAMLLNLKAIVAGRTRVEVFGRTISVPSLRRAHAVVGLSILAYVFYSMLLLGLEPSLSAKELLYEAASALFTVGSSLGVTPELSDLSKVLLSTAMLLGRVGIISLLAGIVGTHTDSGARYPSDNIIIN